MTKKSSLAKVVPKVATCAIAARKRVNFIFDLAFVAFVVDCDCVRSRVRSRDWTSQLNVV